jgi:hypothetical protein
MPMAGLTADSSRNLNTGYVPGHLRKDVRDMKALVCVKRVVDYNVKVRVKSDGKRAVDVKVPDVAARVANLKKEAKEFQ